MDERESVGKQVVNALALVVGSILLGIPLLLLWKWTAKLAWHVKLGPYGGMSVVSGEINRLYMSVPRNAGYGVMVPSALAARADQLAWRCFVTEYVVLLPAVALVLAMLSALVSISRRTACGAGFAAAAMALLLDGVSGRLDIVPFELASIAAAMGGAVCIATAFLGHALGTKLITGRYRYYPW